jgi:hypothetical protein
MIALREILARAAAIATAAALPATNHGRSGMANLLQGAHRLTKRTHESVGISNPDIYRRSTHAQGDG